MKKIYEALMISHESNTRECDLNFPNIRSGEQNENQWEKVGCNHSVGHMRRKELQSNSEEESVFTMENKFSNVRSQLQFLVFGGLLWCVIFLYLCLIHFIV